MDAHLLSNELKLLSKLPRADNAFKDVKESDDNIVQLEIEDGEIIWEILKSSDNAVTVGVDNTGLTPQHFIVVSATACAAAQLNGM
jgi:hypothetical protein